MCLLISSAVASSPGSVSFIHSKSAEHWDLNPKLLGTVISCSLPFFKNDCHYALEQGTQPSSLGDCDCTERLLGVNLIVFTFMFL